MVTCPLHLRLTLDEDTDTRWRTETQSNEAWSDIDVIRRWNDSVVMLKADLVVELDAHDGFEDIALELPDDLELHWPPPQQPDPNQLALFDTDLA